MKEFQEKTQYLILKNRPGNYDFLYFGSPFVYLCNFGIAHHAFHMVFFYIAVTAMNLNGFNSDIHGRLRSIKFCYGTGKVVVIVIVFIQAALKIR